MNEFRTTAPTEPKNADSLPAVSSTVLAKRVIFTMGGKGGVGKTSFMLVLVEWFKSHQIPVTLLDLDTENKSRGSLKHYFDGAVTKVNIHTPAGLDAFVDHLAEGAPIILADMGASSGQVADDGLTACSRTWAATGVAFTAIGIVTPDPASVESILSWAARLQDRVDYVVVENATTHQADFFDGETATRRGNFAWSSSRLFSRWSSVCRSWKTRPGNTASRWDRSVHTYQTPQ